MPQDGVIQEIQILERRNGELASYRDKFHADQDRKGVQATEENIAENLAIIAQITSGIPIGPFPFIAVPTFSIDAINAGVGKNIGQANLPGTILPLNAAAAVSPVTGF
tara:strand:- start:5018 stop:5341 length:324 start_codon:yes stop_codon:yes gene_type:complete